MYVAVSTGIIRMYMYMYMYNQLRAGGALHLHGVSDQV